jgi:SAM-dependent methyltransferase
MVATTSYLTTQQLDFWDSWIVRAESWDTNPDNLRRARYVLSALDRVLRPGHRLLDVGCGTGWMTLCIAKRSPSVSVTGLDLAPKRIERLRGDHPDVEWVAGDFARTQFAHAFDVVVCLETIAHVPDQDAFVRHLAEVLAPGGTVILTSQNPFVWRRTSWLEPPAPGQLRNWPARSRLETLFRRHFRIERLTTCAPGGDRGTAGIMNGRVGRGVGRVIGAARWLQLREQLGLGRSFVLVARRPK